MSSKALNVIIDLERCKGCQYCCSVCPNQVIQISEEYNSSGYHYAIVEHAEACVGCQFCAIMCPEMAIELS